MPTIVRLDGIPEGAQLRPDSNEGLFFTRELEHVLPAMMEKKPRLNFLGRIPVLGNVAFGARTVIAKTFSTGGKARFVGPDSNDIPTVNANAEEIEVPYRTIVMAAKWTFEEVQSAMLAERNGGGVGSLDTVLIDAARRSIEEKVNAVAWEGDSGAKMWGLSNHPAILQLTATNPLSGSTTPDQAIATLNQGLNSIPGATSEVENATDLLLPPAAYRFVSQQQRSAGSDTTTLDFWAASNGQITRDRVYSIRELASIDIMAGGSPTTTSAGIFYDPSEDVLALPYSGIIPLPVQQQGLGYILPLVAKVGGLVVRRPRAVARIVGIV